MSIVMHEKAALRLTSLVVARAILGGVVVSRAVAFVLLAGVAATLVSCSQQAPSSTPLETSQSTESSQAQPPFESAEVFAWIVAACGGPGMVNGAPNSLLPRASDVRLCITPPGRAPVLVGVYDDSSASAQDAAKLQSTHTYASRADDAGRTWIFVVEGTDAVPLRALERYDFTLH